MTGLIRQRLPSVAGVLYSSAAFVLLMGVMTAATRYPIWRHYTTRQEISDLGGTAPPHSTVTQPSATIFDTTMIIAGVLLLAGAFALWRLYQYRVLTVVSTLFGVGTLGVGIFPGNTGPHGIFAMIGQPRCEVDRSWRRRTVVGLPDHRVAGALRWPHPRVDAAYATGATRPGGDERASGCAS